MTYPSQIPESLQTVIYDWFQFREIAGTEKTFPVYFNRVLNRDYNRYNSILNFEAGSSELSSDISSWLKLRLVDTTENGDVNSTETNEHLGSDTSKVESSNNGGNSHTGDVKHVTTAAADDNYVTNSGSDTNSGSIIKTHKQDKAENYDETKSDGKTTSKNTQTTVVDDDSTNTVNGTTLIKQGYSDNVRELSKQNPQSISYSDEQVSSGNTENGGVPSLDWHYSSSQAQRYNEHKIIGTEPDETSSKTVYADDSTTTVEDSGSGTSENNDTRSYNRNETTEDADSRKIQRENTSKTNKNESLVDTYNENTTNSSKGESTETKTYNSNNNIVRSNNSNSSSSSGGRLGYQTLSSIYRDAVDYLEKTSAWEWLSSRLEVCFVGVYDI